MQHYVPMPGDSPVLDVTRDLRHPTVPYEEYGDGRMCILVISVDTGDTTLFAGNDSKQCVDQFCRMHRVTAGDFLTLAYDHLGGSSVASKLRVTAPPQTLVVEYVN